MGSFWALLNTLHNVENILSHLHCVNNQPLYGLRTRCGERCDV
jgi:hypothetical protein